ncbi:MAG: hypothetical protein U9P38_03960 [Campylobacterota bacterium]|nr:hypothetical protein [Campylobacterota bacterium]
MNTKLISLSALILLSLMIISVVLNPSYQKSIQAKYYFETGEYEEALVLAKEAFAIDVYNRMSSTIMSQSLIALKYKSYIDDGKKYTLEIEKIANKEVILENDRAKIRIICEIMVSSYLKLAPSVVTDKELVKTAGEYYIKFEKLLAKVTR